MATAPEILLADRIGNLKRSTVAVTLRLKVTAKDGTSAEGGAIAGAGVVVTSGSGKPLILTCAHVLKPPTGATLKQVDVILDSEWPTSSATVSAKTWATKTRWTDDARDLAVLEIVNADFPAKGVVIAKAPLRPGDDAFWLGHPFAGPPSAGAGLIALVATEDAGTRYRLDGSVNHGNSGGGLFSRVDGSLIGIVNAKQGSLSEQLRVFRDTQPSMSMQIGGVDPVAVLRRTLTEMEENLQLGVGYAIGVDQVPPEHLE